MKKVSEEVQTRVASWLNDFSNKIKSFDETLEFLLTEEKRRRKLDEIENTTYIVLEMAKLCRAEKKWKVLDDQIASIVRRHGQFKLTIQTLIQTCCLWVDETPDLDTKISFMDRLLDVTQGKIYLELERATLTMQKMGLFEKEKGDVKGAAEVVKDLQVETFGSVERRQKTEYIIEQMRIFLACNDSSYFVRAKIRSKNIGPRTLERYPDLAKRYYRLVLEIHHKEKEYLEMSKTLLKLRELGNDQKERDHASMEAVVSVILSQFSKEQHEILLQLSKDSKVEDIPECKKLLSMFTTYEIIHWPFEDASLKDFAKNFQFSTNHEKTTNLEEDFRTRAIQHTIRVIAKYYTDIRMKRLAQFLNVDIESMEKYLSEMVVNGEVHAKIDRLGETVRFSKRKTPYETVNSWGADVDKLIHLVQNVCHEIHRETMVVQARKKIRKK